MHNGIHITPIKPPSCLCLDIPVCPQIKPLVHRSHICVTACLAEPLPLSLCSFQRSSSCQVMTLLRYIILLLHYFIIITTNKNVWLACPRLFSDRPLPKGKHHRTPWESLRGRLCTGNWQILIRAAAEENAQRRKWQKRFRCNRLCVLHNLLWCTNIVG